MKKYETVAQSIKEYISEGTYIEKLPSERELMQKFDVSRVTIRKGLELLKKEYNLTSSKKGGTHIGSFKENGDVKHIVFVMFFSAAESIRIIKGAEKVFSDSNMSLTIKFSNCSAKSERSIISELLTRNLDGLIIYPANSSENVDLFENIMTKNIPLVFVDKYPYEMVCSSVSIDNQEAAKSIVRHLADLGHRDIIFFANDLKNLSTRERLLGFKCEMAARELPFSEDSVHAFSTVDEMKSMFQEVLDSPNKPTGIVCSDDTVAVAFIEQAERRGYRIPDSFSVVGVDDRNFPDYHSIPLTTARQPFYDLGRWSAHIMKQLINSTGIKAEKIYLPTELIIRESTRKIE